MANREPINKKIIETASNMKTNDTTVINQTMSVPNGERAEQILTTEESGIHPKQNEVKARTLKPRKGKTAKSGREESVPDSRKGRLTFSKNVQGHFIMLHNLNDLVNNEFSTNDEFLVMLMDSYVNNNKELEEYKKMFKF